jgi:hypothetical protein
MSIKRIRVLLFKKLNRTELINFNLPLLKKYFRVNFFLLSRKKKQYEVNSVFDNKFVRYTKIKNLLELSKKLKSGDIIFDYHHTLIQNRKYSEFRNIFQNYGIKYLIRLDKAGLLFFDLEFMKKIKFLIKLLYFIIKYKRFFHIFFFFRDFLLVVFNKIYLLINIKQKKRINNNLYNYIDYVLITNNFDDKNPKFNINTSIKIYTHYKDYERCKFVKNKNTIFSRNNNYAVHLDAAFITHPDRFELKEKKIVNYKNLVYSYYEKLNKFFDAFEKQTGKEVIIAAHPKTKIYSSKFFNNRKFFMNKTFELIKNSDCVFNHQSSSTAYAVILNKPIINLICEEFIDLDILDQALANSVALGSRIVTLENYYKLNYNSFFKNKKYNYLYPEYLNNYLKSSKSKEESIWKSLNDKININ